MMSAAYGLEVVVEHTVKGLYLLVHIVLELFVEIEFLVFLYFLYVFFLNLSLLGSDLVLVRCFLIQLCIWVHVFFYLIVDFSPVLTVRKFFINNAFKVNESWVYVALLRVLFGVVL